MMSRRLQNPDTWSSSLKEGPGCASVERQEACTAGHLRSAQEKPKGGSDSLGLMPPRVVVGARHQSLQPLAASLRESRERHTFCVHDSREIVWGFSCGDRAALVVCQIASDNSRIKKLRLFLL